MRAYLCTVLVEICDGDHSYWSEHADETFSIARRLNISWDKKGNGNYLLGYTGVKPNTFPKFSIITEDGEGVGFLPSLELTLPRLVEF